MEQPPGHRKRESEEAEAPYRLYIHALMLAGASLQARCQPQSLALKKHFT